MNVLRVAVPAPATSDVMSRTYTAKTSSTSTNIFTATMVAALVLTTKPVEPPSPRSVSKTLRLWVPGRHVADHAVPSITLLHDRLALEQDMSRATRVCATYPQACCNSLAKWVTSLVQLQSFSDGIGIQLPSIGRSQADGFLSSLRCVCKTSRFSIGRRQCIQQFGMWLARQPAP
jgi:hypothetical protein